MVMMVDVLVIGGGITGCGIALDAASRGLNTILIEKNDFGSGTSSKSSKLIHGGLRYLKQFQFKTTYEASREKTLLKTLAPTLVEDIPFILPYWNLKNRFLYSAGLWVYDLMAGLQKDLIHKRLNKDDTLKAFPTLRQDCIGSFRYFDARTDDKELVFAVANKAIEFGATLKRQVQMTGFIRHNGKIVGVATNDASIIAHKVINATGVWCDEVRSSEQPIIMPSKGIHLIVSTERLGITTAATLPTFDNRIFFLIPQNNGTTIIGTTDTKYDGDIDYPTAKLDDILYLLQCVNNMLPTIKLSVDDVLDTYAGLRPLINTSKSAFKTSRDHKIFEDKDGLINVVGGKLTTYRIMAKDTVDKITNKKSITNKIKLGS